MTDCAALAVAGASRPELSAAVADRSTPDALSPLDMLDSLSLDAAEVSGTMCNQRDAPITASCNSFSS